MYCEGKTYMSLFVCHTHLQALAAESNDPLSQEFYRENTLWRKSRLLVLGELCKDLWSPSLFVVRFWKQCKLSLTEEWINKISMIKQWIKQK